jgi:hypothetical protein
MVSFAQVDIKEIKSNSIRSSFSEDKINEIADLILSKGGVFRPLILKRIDVDEYELLDGELEYFSSVRAREKDPKKGEMVNAFLVSPNEEEEVRRQIDLLNSSDSLTLEEQELSSRNPGELPNSSSWIDSFENRMSEVREELFMVKRDYESRFVRLERNLSENSSLSFLEAVNTLETMALISELTRCGMPKLKIEAICNARDNKASSTFESYQDIVKSAKGIGHSGILNLMDAWERMNQRKR